MENILTVLHIIVTVFLIIVVLMQRSEGGGVGLGTVSTGGLVSVRGQANFMTKLTGILAALFIILSMSLAVISIHTDKNKSSFLEKLSAEPDKKTEESTPAPNIVVPNTTTEEPKTEQKTSAPPVSSEKSGHSAPAENKNAVPLAQ